MKTRVISAVILLPLLILVVWQGGLLLWAVLACAAIIGLYEFYRATKINNRFWQALAVFQVIVAVGCLVFDLQEYLILSLIVTLFLLLMYFIVQYPKVSLEEIGLFVLGLFYIVLPIVTIGLIRDLSFLNGQLIWLVFVIAFGSDSFAYLVGVSIGKTPLVPKLSPNKTREGALGGILGAGILTTLVGLLLVDSGNTLITGLILFGVGCIGAVISQLGDLVGSAAKRLTDIKDFGDLIPGHGGILDRLDSLLLTAPYVYIIGRLLVEVLQ